LKSKNIIKIIIIPITCLLFTPLVFVAIPVAFSEPNPHVDYALDFVGGNVALSQGLDKFDDLTYFSFYTFFKSGIEPDCIDMVDESKRLMNND